MVIYRGGTIIICALTVVILSGSLYLANSTSLSNPSLSFYSSYTRAWELMFGSLASILLLHSKGLLDIYFRDKTILLNVLSLSCVGVLLASFCLFCQNTLHPGAYTLFPVVASFLLIVVMGRGDIVTRVLSNSMLVYVGLLSYSLYLIHNPIFSYIDIYYDYLSDERRHCVQISFNACCNWAQYS